MDQTVSLGSSLAKAMREFERARQYGVEGEILDARAIAQREPI